MPLLIIGGAILLAFVGYSVAASQASAAADSAAPLGDDTPGVPAQDFITGDPTMSVGIDPGNRATWPVGDAVWRFCQAVAYAEGYGASPSNAPTTHHNPGDLGPGDTGYPGEVHSGSVVSLMPDDATGWSALYTKWARIFSGNSATYPNTLTILQAAQKYAADWKNWSKNVSSDLGVSESTRLIDWYNAQ